MYYGELQTNLRLSSLVGGYQVSSLLYFSQVYNNKQHDMHVQHFKYFSMAVTLQLDY